MWDSRSRRRSIPDRNLRPREVLTGSGEFRIVEFADLAAFVGTGGVEVAQGGEAESVGTVVGFEGLARKTVSRRRRD